MHPDNTNDYYTDNGQSPVTQSGETPNAVGNDASDSNQSSTISFGSGSDQTPSNGKKKTHRWRKFLLWLTVIIVIVLSIAIYIRYFNPYVTDARVSGYVTNVEKRGLFFKTFEGEMISQQKLADPTHIYTRDFYFTVTNDSVADILQGIQGSGRLVTLTYDRYWGVLPWRGGSTIVVTGVLQDVGNQH